MQTEEQTNLVEKIRKQWRPKSFQNYFISKQKGQPAQLPMLCDMLLWSELCFSKFLFSKVSEEFMDCVNVVLWFNDVFEGNGPNNPIAIHGTLHSNPDKVKGPAMDWMGILHHHIWVFWEFTQPWRYNHASSKRERKKETCLTWKCHRLPL